MRVSSGKFSVTRLTVTTVLTTTEVVTALSAMNICTEHSGLRDNDKIPLTRTYGNAKVFYRHYLSSYKGLKSSKPGKFFMMISTGRMRKARLREVRYRLA